MSDSILSSLHGLDLESFLCEPRYRGLILVVIAEVEFVESFVELRLASVHHVHECPSLGSTFLESVRESVAQLVSIRNFTIEELGKVVISYSHLKFKSFVKTISECQFSGLHFCPPEVARRITEKALELLKDLLKTTCSSLTFAAKERITVIMEKVRFLGSSTVDPPDFYERDATYYWLASGLENASFIALSLCYDFWLNEINETQLEMDSKISDLLLMMKPHDTWITDAYV